MNWFVKLDSSSSNLNSNYFVTCLLIFFLHFSPQSLSFASNFDVELFTNNNLNFSSDYGVQK
ncbi:hypothetical protein DEO72_LG1g3033 [Vigna unguiculata]|uniref:Uncharacterized protein n=1 Tax=Vigna unguiculata TaxID=3917 RepID=A0A4D6KS63_VIGUN|nr:hypothetical protein DEO72_LG1g3033 [Vigna unguiculata]